MSTTTVTSSACSAYSFCTPITASAAAHASPLRTLWRCQPPGWFRNGTATVSSTASVTGVTNL